MKIFLVRHGETTGDIADRYGGWYDDHLTARGRAQLEITAARLIGQGIELIYSSSLIRAKEAANIIATELRTPIEYVDGMRERNYGILTGLTKQEAQERYPEVVARHGDYRNTDPEGESYDDFCSRVMAAFTSITAANHKIIAIVTHGGPIKCMYRSLGKGELSSTEDGGIRELDV